MAVMVGTPAPEFKGPAVVGGPAATLNPDNAFKEIRLSDFRGKWVVFFFYPLDFTFVCPTEIAEFGNAYEDFRDLDAEVIGVSTDSKHSHLAWRHHEDKLKNLPFMLLADNTKQIARDYNVLKEETGYALRGTFIIDPDGVLQYMVVHNEDVGRSIPETKRVLEALQTGELCPCNWNKGQATLSNAEPVEA
ncbi:MAG TPA: peroxiredoxin [Candidatus Kapabacteria bacterium]|nr:peroxiredoxin [Candidatus Kapabacteria bacterium]